MGVKRITRAPARAAAKKRRGLAPSIAYPPLPDGPKEPVTDPLKYTLLLYGREKIGKTTWLASYPDVLFLTTEPGTKGMRIQEYNHEKGGCTDWNLIRAAVDLLEANPERYQAVVIDTADRAYDMCMDYVCSKMGIEHPGESPDGKEDWGKSWKEVKKEFTEIVHRIIRTGRGLCFTSHSKEEEFKSRSGERFTRIFPSMSGQARAVIQGIVDLFFYVEYMRAPDRGTSRVIITHGDELVWAGHRELDGVELPLLIPMTKRGGFDILKAAFEGQSVGLDPKTLLPNKSAPDVVREFYKHLRGDSAPPARRKTGLKKAARK